MSVWESIVSEAEERLEHLRRHGPTPFAFTFKQRYSPLLAEQLPVDDQLGCPA
jgi:Domain of unknown function (DUF3291)